MVTPIYVEVVARTKKAAVLAVVFGENRHKFLYVPNSENTAVCLENGFTVHYSGGAPNQTEVIAATTHAHRKFVQYFEGKFSIALPDNGSWPPVIFNSNIKKFVVHQ